MLESIETIQNDYFQIKSEADRKILGQFFTGAKIAEYMASILYTDPRVCNHRLREVS